MKEDNLRKNMDYVEANFEKLLNLYRNKFILVNGQEVVGSYDKYETAAETGVNTYGINEGFLVHFITEITPINFLAAAVL